MTFADPLFDDVIKACEGTADDEQDIGGVDLDELLVWMLAPALRRHRAVVPSDLQRCLLHALTLSRVIDGFSLLRATLSISSM